MQITGQAIAMLEGQFDYLVVELNRMEEEELQSQLMARGHDMIMFKPPPHQRVKTLLKRLVMSQV
jgi:hypothetical protein